MAKNETKSGLVDGYHPLVVAPLEPKYPSRRVTGETSYFVGSVRFSVLLILFFCNTVMYLARINMSVAIVYMYRDDQEFEKSVVLSAFYWGYASSQILAGYLAARYGGRIVLLVSILGCGIGTCIIPLDTSMPMVVGMRALIGMCQGANYPSQMILLSGWIPWFERSRALSIISAGESLGTIVALFGGPYLVAHTKAWASIFWVTGLAAIAAFAMVFVVLFEGPEDMHSSGWLSSEEMRFIHSGRSIIIRPKSVPWGKFFRSVPYLSCICVHFCSDWGYLLILCYLPSYWRNVYQVNDSQMAFFSVLPCIGIPIVSILGATFADWLLSQKVSLLAVRKGMTALGLGAPALCFHLLSYCKPCKASCPAFWFALGVMVLGVSLRGFQTGGWASNYLDIGPSHVSHLFSIANSIGAVSGILAPLVTGAIISDSIMNWSYVFNTVAVLYLLGGLVFVSFAKAHVLFH
uniref:Major facilitator superfamily (MFS) profile domain-containing protein n=1 Tax=Lotharella oceanica TaxID=641309 RepID=A0A7S2TNU4_9EUKA|mmetsp:Transcript_22739/g.42700  ORF Transcript_22739/g.42700 Transcript_22739/m.42700 type:complete len:463 (+) Transcript_22739:50-1438(+)